MPARIDSHQHFWQRARGDYAWLHADVPGLRPLLRDFVPDDLRPTLATHDVKQTVLVQAAASEAETSYLLDLAEAHDWIGAVVGWVDLSAPASIQLLKCWATHPKFKGVRPMLQDLPDQDWIAHATHPEVIAALMQFGLRVDALVRPRQLAPLLHFLRQYPALPVVLDHAAKPQIGAGWDADWADVWMRDLAAVASHPQVMCKLSGLLTEANAAQRRDSKSAVAALRPAWEHLLRCFGPQRLMWGSDWPVLTLAGDYARWIEVSEALLSELSAAQQELIWQGNARAFYGLN